MEVIKLSENNLATQYNPTEVEAKWYQFWEENKFFHAEPEVGKKPFTIVMPPPNVTGQLHLGHALDNTLQDILIRFRRMQGFNTLWIPGTDHAGIATQAKVEEQLAKEGLSKYDLGREEFLKRVWAWKEEYGSTITKQLRYLGNSCDWDRERFTMDEGCSKAVQEVFVSLYKKGLIYRGNYIINWCPKCQTTISDIEVEHENEAGKLYHLRYPIKDSCEYIVVATTRPETMLGDTAVAVHPEDERYKHLIGKSILLPLTDREIPIIADTYVDPAFGTGAVKITPSHDINDFEMGLRHNLPQMAVLDKNAAMTKETGKFAGMDRYDARKAVVAAFEELGLLVKIDEHEHAVGHCYRCDTTVEPLISRQWFVKMQPLAKPAMQAAIDGKVKFVPERFTKVYLSWMENIRDWCISRQLWWGHRIPVWYCKSCGAEICQEAAPTGCPRCASHDLEQDPDVLDTWFSSALWPFSTLGWPENTAELKQFYPTSVLVTGRDIIFFWVARMIFTGLEFMEEVPFKEVFIHGLVLDPNGKKMSKSLGNGVDPIEVIEKYGTDTLRFMLITGNTPGNDMRFQFERLDATRNFANKIWNASRFTLMNLKGFVPGGEVSLEQADKWILKRLNDTVQDVTTYLEKYELGEAGRAMYEFIWNELCDWYIEIAKPRLYLEDGLEHYTAQHTLWTVLKGALELIHPFMPFISEEIWQQLPHDGKTIMLTPWPTPVKAYDFVKEEKDFSAVMEIVKSIRNIRGEMNVHPAKKAEVILVVQDESMQAMLRENEKYFRQLASAEQVTVLGDLEIAPENSAAAVAKGVRIFVPLKDLIDYDKEIARLTKELNTVFSEKARIDGKLSNQGFVAKAPAEVIAKEEAKLKELLQKEAGLSERLQALQAQAQ